ncbi:MAG: hypothetical protein WCV68_01175 [Candidatus Paceibacterota bacterium]|jgi:hypothetical protein
MDQIRGWDILAIMADIQAGQNSDLLAQTQSRGQFLKVLGLLDLQTYFLFVSSKVEK